MMVEPGDWIHAKHRKQVIRLTILTGRQAGVDTVSGHDNQVYLAQSRALLIPNSEFNASYRRRSLRSHISNEQSKLGGNGSLRDMNLSCVNLLWQQRSL